MISFENFSRTDGSPIYAQILLFFKRGVASGAILDGDELPSRRVLSAQLTVNPNTVQKAYRMLEEEGLILSHAGVKSFAVVNDTTREKIRAELIEEGAREAVHALRALGISLEDANTFLKKYWDMEIEQGGEDSHA